MDNFREAMHGDAARTAALLLIACSTCTDAPLARQRCGYPLSAPQVSAPGGGRSALAMQSTRFAGCAGEYAHPKIQRCCLHRTLCASSVSVCGPQAPC